MAAEKSGEDAGGKIPADIKKMNFEDALVELEEIVGDIDDEYDNTEPDPIERVSPTVNELDARVHIDDLVEEFDYDLPEDRDRDYDTIGGFVVAHLGRIPEQDESFTWRDLKVTVLKCDERRVLRIRIEHDDSHSHHSVDE